MLPSPRQDHVSYPLPFFDLFHYWFAGLSRAFLTDKSHTLSAEPTLLVWPNVGLQKGNLLTVGTSEGVVFNRSRFWVYQD
jgi:hypothetical protein